MTMPAALRAMEWKAVNVLLCAMPAAQYVLSNREPVWGASLHRRPWEGLAETCGKACGVPALEAPAASEDRTHEGGATVVRTQHIRCAGAVLTASPQPTPQTLLSSPSGKQAQKGQPVSDRDGIPASVAWGQSDLLKGWASAPLGRKKLGSEESSLEAGIWGLVFISDNVLRCPENVTNRPRSAGWHPTAWPWCSPVEHKQFHTTPTSDETTVTTVDQDNSKTLCDCV